MGTPTAASGQWGTVVWATDKSGKNSARVFFSKLDKPDRAKIQAAFNLLASSGRIKSQERFKKLGERHGQLMWEVKSFQVRFIGTFSRARQFVVAHGLRKKQDRHRDRDLETAARILNEHFEELENDDEARR